MDIGEMEYFEDFENNGEAGLRYRLIVKGLKLMKAYLLKEILLMWKVFQIKLSGVKK